MSKRDVTSWLPNLLGPVDFQVNEVDQSIPKRLTLNLAGASLAVFDDPSVDRTTVMFPIAAVAGTPSDSSFIATPSDGALGIDTTNSILYFRAGSAWHAAGGGGVSNFYFPNGAPGFVGWAASSASPQPASFRGQNNSAGAGASVNIGGGTGTTQYGQTNIVTPLNGGYVSQAMADADQTLSVANSAANEIVTTGANTATRTLTISVSPTAGVMKWIRNNCTGSSLSVKWLTGTSVTLPPNSSALVTADGTNAKIHGAGDSLQGVGVSTTAPVDQYALVYQSSTGLWTPAAAGWQTAIDVDFTALTGTNPGSNGNITLSNGQVWVVSNFSAASLFTIGGANGLRMKLASSGLGTALAAASVSGPCLSSPALSTLLTTGTDPHVSIRLSMWIKSQNSAVSSELIGLMVGSSSLGNQQCLVGRRNNSGTIDDHIRTWVASTSKVSWDFDTPVSGHDCFQIVKQEIASDDFTLYTGQYSAGFPAPWSFRARCPTVQGASSGWGPTNVRTAADSVVTLGISGGTGGVFDVQIGRVKIEYRV